MLHLATLPQIVWVGLHHSSRQLIRKC